MRLLPAEKVPKLNTDGEKYRDQQLVYQLPKQDLSLKYCHHVEAAHHTSFQDFVCARNDIALDVGHAVDGVKERNNGSAACCNKCRKAIGSCNGGGGLAVIAPRFGISTMWHPACFTCTTCDELLVSASGHSTTRSCGTWYKVSFRLCTCRLISPTAYSTTKSTASATTRKT